MSEIHDRKISAADIIKLSLGMDTGTRKLGEIQGQETPIVDQEKLYRRDMRLLEMRVNEGRRRIQQPHTKERSNKKD